MACFVVARRATWRETSGAATGHWFRGAVLTLISGCRAAKTVAWHSAPLLNLDSRVSNKLGHASKKYTCMLRGRAGAANDASGRLSRDSRSSKG